LPEQSFARHVFVRAYVPLQLPAVLVSLTSTTAGAVSQESDAVGAVNDGMAGHWIVALAPADPSDGTVVSETVIVWLTESD
jgi:hypothetical protein